MSIYSHLLLALDFSAADDAVAHKAQALVQSNAACLSLIHVLDNIPMPDTPYGTLIALDEASGDAQLEAEKTKLLAWGKRLAVATENLWLVWGVPKQEIARIAEQQNVDLIVVGSHGRYGLALLLGATADGVLHHAPCDMLAVRLRA
jgi:universal stress protein A